MNKKQIAKQYIKNHVDFIGLKRDIRNSWIKGQSAEMLAGNGLIFNYFYDIELKAIKVVNYKYPKSDRTWETITSIRIELLKEMKQNCKI